MSERHNNPMPEELPELAALREEIAKVDASLVAMLNRRAALSLRAGEIKRNAADAAVFRPGREAELLQTLASMSRGPLPAEHLRAIYREILSSSRYLQRPQRVAFLGPEGTFSHTAGLRLLGSLASFHPQPSLAAVFLAVESGDCDIGIVPLENSLHGGIGQALDLFAEHRLFIRADCSLLIRHSLLSLETNLASIRSVYSHPQPLLQCGNWLKNHLPRAAVIPLESTAAAARRVAGEPQSAAIAHADIARALNLHILARHIEDHPDNRTRFAVIGSSPADRPGADKSSLLFSVADKAGSLYKVLRCVADREINMSKLESRPMPGAGFRYLFFADLDCDMYEEAYAGLAEEIAGHCLTFRLLGSYPSNLVPCL